MGNVIYIEREMTDSEFSRMKEGFNEHGLLYGNPPETAERFGFVALEEQTFIGCSSCLVYKYGNDYGNWSFITDLFVEVSHRHHGIGSHLLKSLEERVRKLGIKYIYTYTAGFEAPDFYQRQGYEIFVEQKNWYRSGHSRVGLQKQL